MSYPARWYGTEGNTVEHATKRATLPGMSLHGRWYTPLGPQKYPWPIDDLASKNLDLFNKFFFQKRGKHFCAPLPEHTGRVRRVLDLGTGSGVWACQIAEGDTEYNVPTDVMAIDINMIQPEFIPHNLTILLQDLEEPIWSPAVWFNLDLVHIRLMNGSIHPDRWGDVYRNAFQRLAPGRGFIEHVELDWVPRWCEDIPENSALKKWSQCFRDGVANLGRSVEIDGPRVRSTLAGAGFVRLKEEANRCFLSPQLSRDKRKSEQWLNATIRKSILDWSLAPLIDGLGFTPTQVYALCDQVDLELSCCRSSVHFTLYSWIAERPAY